MVIQSPLPDVQGRGGNECPVPVSDFRRNSMNRLSRMVHGAMIAGFALLLAPSASTAVTAPPSNISTMATSGAKLAGKLVPLSPARPLPAPAGCPEGAVCFYHQGNGGDLCGIFYRDASDLGGCTKKAYSVYNNGLPCGGCQDVGLYFGSGYYNAWYCLPKGNYLLYMDKDRFNRLGTRGDPSRGLNDPMANNVASAKWLSC